MEESDTNRLDAATQDDRQDRTADAKRWNTARVETIEQVRQQVGDKEENASALEAVRSRPVRPPQTTSSAPSRDMPLAFAYLRVSTKEQARTGGGAEGYSLPAQRAACHAKAQQLGAMLGAEYVDAGESAKSADRDELQRMLRDVKRVKPDFVIVHKIDRLARNREDDIAINLRLRKSGVRLVSCTENIDDTPSGKLLYGLMAEIAQFYSGNLAQEVLKGLVRKAEEGGTPYRAPLGYLNVRRSEGAFSYSTVELDEERAPLVRWCLEQYATGEWTVADLTLAAQAKGLTNRPTATRPAAPITFNTLHHVLRNPYYMGLVPYQGIHYQGKHQALIEPETWLAIQDTLTSHNHTGEKDRKHPHYLRGTIYCSACGGRLVYSRNTGNGGTYEYYFCVKRKTKANNCHRPAVRVARIEAGITSFYEGFRINSKRIEEIRVAVLADLASQRAEAQRDAGRAERRLSALHDERQKLLQAHYAGAIPTDLLGSEMQRITRALAEADSQIQIAKVATTDLEATLADALAVAGNCHHAYQTAPDGIRRKINQGLFRKLFIGDDGSVEHAELTEPFAALHGVEQQPVTSPETTQMAASTLPQSSTFTPSSVFHATFGSATSVADGNQKTTDSEINSHVRGLNEAYVVGAAGFEPATPSL